MKYITIDGGTTNTRISIIDDNTVKNTIKIHLGAKSGIDNKKELKELIKKAIGDLNVYDDIDAILASGMITSEFGLYNVAHITAPVGIKELHDNTCTVTLSDIAPIPFSFIPGVKTVGNELCRTDMMRGEETELFGLCDAVKPGSLYILPGSHSKIIRIDNMGKIKDFVTLLTGEMIAALSQDTILKSSVNLSQSDADENYLAEGFCYCKDHGLNEALFKVRILDNIYKVNERQVYSFFLGAVLHDEIREIVKFPEKEVVIGGKSQIKNAMYQLLVRFSDKNVERVLDSISENANIRGMIKIFEVSS